MDEYNEDCVKNCASDYCTEVFNYPYPDGGYLSPMHNRCINHFTEICQYGVEDNCYDCTSYEPAGDPWCQEHNPGLYELPWFLQRIT